MIQVEESAVVKRPPEEVFALVGDPKNDQQWASTVREARQTSPGPLGVDTTFEQALRLLGRRIELGIEVREYEPNRELGISPMSGPFEGTGRRIAEPIDGGTRLTLAGVYLEAFETDTRPLLAGLRESLGVDADPVAAFRAGGYAERLAQERGTAAVESAYKRL